MTEAKLFIVVKRWVRWMCPEHRRWLKDLTGFNQIIPLKKKNLQNIVKTISTLLIQTVKELGTKKEWMTW